jgi:hypothetical protein
MANNQNSRHQGRKAHNVKGKRSGTRSFGGKRRPLPESVVIDRKGRKVGSDDLHNAALVAKWSEEAGLRGPAIQAASGIAIALDAAIALSLQGLHRDAGKKAASCAYVLKRNEKVGTLKVQCRDGKTRKLSQVVEWYAGVHFRIADEIEAKREEEAEMAETRRRNAELKRQARKVISEAAEKKAA